MKKIGIIGEDPYDTSAIKNLLVKKYPKQFSCKALLTHKKGWELDTKNTEKSLKIEFEDYKPDLVIFVRDADGIATEDAKIQKVKNWFTKLNGIVNKKGILLINIYELEALILADIETFNKIYSTTIKYTKNVMYQKEPKEFLMGKTEKLRKKYSESHCPNIFDKLNFDVVMKNCDYFRTFNATFSKALKPK